MAREVVRFKDVAGKDILNELNQIGHCDVGHFVITKGYGLKTKFHWVPMCLHYITCQ